MNRICAGISRASRFSPNRENNDNAVFSQVAAYLRENGWDVHLYSEAEFIAQERDERYIFHMAREESTIDRLEKLEQACAVVVNPAQSIKNCRRDALTHILTENGIPYPRSFTAETSCSIEELLQKDNMGACWLKRGDMHTIYPDDVCFAPTPDIAREQWAAFARRGIERGVVTEHLTGDLIKFYGVTGEPFSSGVTPNTANSTNSAMNSSTEPRCFTLSEKGTFKTFAPRPPACWGCTSMAEMPSSLPTVRYTSSTLTTGPVSRPA